MSDGLSGYEWCPECACWQGKPHYHDYHGGAVMRNIAEEGLFCSEDRETWTLGEVRKLRAQHDAVEKKLQSALAESKRLRGMIEELLLAIKKPQTKEAI